MDAQRVRTETPSWLFNNVVYEKTKAESGVKINRLLIVTQSASTNSYLFSISFC